ncbi:30S ribosomal protein S1 [Lentilactobacillus hilgardii]|uniref:Putative ribosomal protein S1 n=1 Tax=Lentilactobacillus hilgardii (strain ATCC 8290 / DSM 20176 / CCUG 30140 / JCM 1155 / KCTC 3500 / NBRC 15886 / NCIMB 8040 / NRRL B-1843 / 9) TaxID=1423757 RepID=C0XLS6_LENH9|nr:30S ribosomal protein S1 [Lentilactobacillus hilgardii]EEI18505.1 putative ribosomal protein S1 [Lentilactobacillus buchneri ATCC 11577]EEI23646.1 putative ribosomal protein S1 [Lentilactobacillus hilgardii DSM 20176 = ATCC 8290]KRK56484.1 30S ribosomal protein S1 [Lentilactobacillus hilgardii DSM 20176 = ATCC 8290]MCP9332205.1 30S ribosomal protein S1 [Lentilactobacillus hilgardii]MCP9348835.1 30S ribosomal protein S1 [Lentilactobacillus hilgardii]
MSENANNDKNDLLNALNSVSEVNVGDVVTGEVLAKDDEQQLIVGIDDTGVEGVVPQRELSSSQNFDDIKQGDKLQLVVTSRIGSDKEGGSFLLSSRRLEARKVWDELAEKSKNGETITAKVSQAVKGGLVVDAGVRGFIPASMISDHYVEDLNQFKNQELELKIIEIDPVANRLILSHKAILQAQKAEEREKLMDTLHEGDIVEGKVARLTNFGAFVDLGGMDGLVHVSQIAYERVEKPSDVLKVGQEVKVKVLSVDFDRNRISLSIKQTLPEPWDGIEEKAPAGSVLEGTVKRLVDFGAFVEVFPGVEGLVHISQIAHEHIATPGDVLKVGEKIKVKVLDVDPDRKRLALSIKALTDKPKESSSSSKSSNRRPSTNVDNNSRNNAPDEETGFTFGDIIGNELKKNSDDDNNN